MLTRRLALKKETLAALTSDDMSGVGGGAPASEATCYTCLGCTTTLIAVSPSVLAPTNCCHGIPTFHGAGGAAAC